MHGLLPRTVLCTGLIADKRAAARLEAVSKVMKHKQYDAQAT
jgi:hypothetical protein